GAVAAVMMLSAIYNPRQVVFLFLVIPVSIWVIVVMMIVMDGFTLLAQVPSQVASAAHLGGLLFGYLYYRWSMRLTDLVRFHFHFRVVRSRPRLKLFSPESEQTPVSTRQADQYQAARVDAILEKVGRVGVKGLTEEERRTLIQASEHIRRRDK
ncbi:MAG: rhomboid family intramembrane serine protease, partial [Planctomycetia bacterium]|nr:rhomboid family intramembrane serine protease [Planctomycetia bacterium]